MIRSSGFSVTLFSEFKTKLDQIIKHVEFKPTLAFALITPDFPISKIMDIFKSMNIKLIGTTTAGVINFTQQEDLILEKGGVFVLTDLKQEYFTVDTIELNSKSWFQLGKEAGLKAHAFTKNPAIIYFSGGIHADGHALTQGILSVSKSDIELHGSLAGDDLKFEKTHVFTETELLEEGIVLLTLNTEKISVHGMSTSGWVELGSEFTITSSKENVIYKINNQPALDLYTSYLSISVDDLPVIGIEYPLMIKMENNSMATRMITGINRKDHSIILSGSVPKNCKVTFSASPGFEILENTRQKMIQFYTKHAEADILLLLSGVARNIALGPLISTEIKLAPIKWKAPLYGFFGYGETGKEDHQCSRFSNQSHTLILLRDNHSL